MLRIRRLRYRIRQSPLGGRAVRVIAVVINGVADWLMDVAERRGLPFLPSAESLRAIRERSRREAADCARRMQLPAGLSLDSFSMFVHRVFGIEELDQMREGLALLLGGKESIPDWADSNDARSESLGGWGIVGTLWREPPKWFFSMNSRVLSDLPDEVCHLSFHVNRVLWSTFVLVADVTLTDTAVRELAALREGLHLPRLDFHRFNPFKPVWGGYVQYTSDDATRDAVFERLAAVEQRVSEVLEPYFGRRRQPRLLSEASLEVSGVDVVTLRGVGDTRPEDPEWWRESRFWLRSLDLDPARREVFYGEGLAVLWSGNATFRDQLRTKVIVFWEKYASAEGSLRDDDNSIHVAVHLQLTDFARPYALASYLGTLRWHVNELREKTRRAPHRFRLRRFLGPAIAYSNQLHEVCSVARTLAAEIREARGAVARSRSGLRRLMLTPAPRDGDLSFGEAMQSVIEGRAEQLQRRSELVRRVYDRVLELQGMRIAGSQRRWTLALTFVMTLATMAAVAATLAVAVPGFRAMLEALWEALS